MKKIAIVYHYVALYRLPIFQELMALDSDLSFTILSGVTSEINIKKVDPSLSIKPISEGGLRWEILKNYWLFRKKLLWQSDLVRHVLKSSSDTYIFLGSPYFVSTWVAAALARLKGKQVYFWMHGVYREKITAFDRVKLFAFYKLAHGFFLYGNRSAKTLLKYNVTTDDNIHVIYNSLNYSESLNLRLPYDKQRVELFRRTHFTNVDIPIVVFIGRLNKIKRLDMLIQVQSLLKSKYNTAFFNLLIIGDGEEKQNLETQTVTLGVGNTVKFLGAIYDEAENATYLANSDLCVTPGEVGLTAIHSLSYGTPVVSHDNLNVQMPEVEAIIQGETGSLYKYGSLESLAEEIEIWLIKNPFKSQSLVSTCYNVIDTKYNPIKQAAIFRNVLKN